MKMQEIGFFITKQKQSLIYNMKYTLILFFLLLTFCSKGQVSISPDHENILYTGRFAFTDLQAPSFSMNGASIKVNFNGTKITGRFSNKGNNSYLYVIIDGQADVYNRQVLEISGNSESEYIIAENLSDSQHTLELVKLNESEGQITFFGFEVEGAGLTTKPTRPPLQLEFIGDSNTAGWSAWDAKDQGGSHASGAYYTFPGITSRLLNAEYSLIGGSGSGIANQASWNLTQFYYRIHLGEPVSANNTWDFSNNYWNFQPSAVVVNLGANDYYANTSKQVIKDSWKDFITNTLRVKYPNAHIVLANSYGWAYNEPADYVDEAITELQSAGDQNVSYVRFPWLWGQAHAVINEHAGFANLLATHLAAVLNLPVPMTSDLSSFVEKGELYNGSFEKSILPNVADGWRPHGSVLLKEDAANALDGNKYLELKNGAWVNFSTEVEAGDSLVLKGWAKGAQENSSGFFKIEIKDQAQSTIQTQQIQPDFTTAWKEFSTSIKVPEGVWSAWIVLATTNTSTLYFDNIQLGFSTSLNEALKDSEKKIKIYPNPAKHFVQIESENENPLIEVFDETGKQMSPPQKANELDISNFLPGIYWVRIKEENALGSFVKQ
jgi:hypothetical protein